MGTPQLFFFCFLEPHSWYMEVPRPGVKSALQLLPYTTAHSSYSSCPTPQLTESLDPQPTERGQGSNMQPWGSWLDLFPLHHHKNALTIIFSIWLQKILPQKCCLPASIYLLPSSWGLWFCLGTFLLELSAQGERNPIPAPVMHLIGQWISLSPSPWSGQEWSFNPTELSRSEGRFSVPWGIIPPPFSG